MSDNTASTIAVTVERTFDAPIELVWQLWTDPEHFKNWYGPTGFSIPVAEMDVRVGGKRLVCMESPDGSMTLWTGGEFTELQPHTRLAYTEFPSDEQGNEAEPPFAGHPGATDVTVVLESVNGQTKMVMTHAGLPQGAEGARDGWEQAFTKMADRIDTLQKAD